MFFTQLLVLNNFIVTIHNIVEHDNSFWEVINTLQMTGDQE